MKRGLLIVFEGCDRAGKSTQCRKLAEALEMKGEKCTLLRFPDRSTVIGKMIGSYLEMKSEMQDNAVHLLFSANRWEMVPIMQKLLDEGQTLIVDRYAYSGVAFTAAKQSFDMEWCKQPDVGLPKPDTVFYLDIKLEEAEKRADFGEERYENQTFQKRVQQNFQLLQETNWKVIDASQSIDDIHHRILQTVEDVFDKDLTKPMETLWK